MGFGSTTLNRMADVILALHEAERAGVQPTRIQLQKFVYLADVLGHVVGLFKPREGHKTYKNGPYDLAIQNAADSLAFRGLVVIAGVWQTPSGTLGTRYKLAPSGKHFLEKCQSHPPLSRKIEITTMIGDQLMTIGWDKIVRLVYAEPTYVATRPSGWGAPLHPEDGLNVSASLIVAIMRRAVRALSGDKMPTTEWLVDRFFAFLVEYDANFGAHLTVDS